MKSLQFSVLIPLIFAALLSFSWASLPHENFIQCLSHRSNDFPSMSSLIFTPTHSSYSSVLDFRLQNLRWNSTDATKPKVIVTPTETSHIQDTIFCAKKHGLQIKTRSGGHDYEGLSFVSQVPFVLLDLVHFGSVDVDVENRVVWVQSGAILGELYYRIAEKTRTLAFPGGVFHSVGIGGYLSGGGVGLLFRKYGTAGDNVIDAQLIDVNGRILDRKSMGEDLFWAIRGGDAASFGIVLAWKLQLVPVPATVTSCTVIRAAQNAAQLIHRWQYVGHEFPDEIYMYIGVLGVDPNQDGKKTLLASFNSLFLGTIDELLPIMQERFPELGLSRQDCTEMNWVEAIPYFNMIQDQPLEILLNRTYKSPMVPPYAKMKSDYVKEPISEAGLDGLFSRLTSEDDIGSSLILLFTYGGIMNRIPEDATPFPHRAGNLYKIAYNMGWQEEHNINSQKIIDWARSAYDYLTPFVSKSPREAYMNYRDLDLGTNNQGYTSYEQASIWGHKYFKNNFDRLVRVKTKFDPENFFKHEQSIPPLIEDGVKTEL